MDPVTLAKSAQIALSLVRSRRGRALIGGIAVMGLVFAVLWANIPAMLLSQIIAGSLQQQGQQYSVNDTSCTVGLGSDGGGASTSFPNLTSQQVAVAQLIWRTTTSTGMLDQAAVVAIAVALQESQLGAAPDIDQPNDDGDAGVFQQRTLPGWYGTLNQVRDLRYATRTFLQGKKITKAEFAAAKKAGSRAAGPVGYTIPGLTQIAGWQTKTVTQAAQAVQRSAFPGAYAKHERTAQGLLALFKSGKTVGTPAGNAALNSGLCGGGSSAATCPVTGMAVEQGLTPDALRVLRCAAHTWTQITSWAGVGDRPSNVDRDHQEGRAVDIMIPDPTSTAGHLLGDKIVAWAIANQTQLGIKYVIWQAQIWSVQRASEGWRSCGTAAAGCYNGPDDTAAHRDHVHVSVFGTSAGAAFNSAGTPGGTTSGEGLVRPVDHYVLTARFGQCSSHWVACHTGLDFAAGPGTPIKAIMDGEVTFVGPGGSYGNFTKIRHADGTESWYAHQLRQTVTVGQRVRAGQQIGLVGATGNVTGPHLHLEIRIGGNPVDPDPWMTARGVRP